MSKARPTDPCWPKVLSLTVHELRTPMTVVAGYIRMLLKDRAGPLNDQQRTLLEEAEKSCGRLTALVSEVSELANLEAGTAPFNRQGTDVHAAIRAGLDKLPSQPDRDVIVDLQLGGGPAPIQGDPVRLTQAFGSVISGLRRELVTTDRLIVRGSRTTHNGTAVHEFLIGDEETLTALAGADTSTLPVFDEWRGGCGLSLGVARRIIEAHHGRIWGVPDGRKAGARIVLPEVAGSRH